MKRIILVFGIIISCLVISCKDDNMVFTDNDSIRSRALSDISLNMTDKEILAMNGYDTINIVEKDSFYIVDETWIFRKSRFDEIRNSNTRISIPMENKLSLENQRIFLFLGNDNDPEIEKYFKEAVDEWNKVGRNYIASDCAINFKTFYSDDRGERPSVYVIINRTVSSSFGDDTFILVDGVLQGIPGQYVYINPYHKYWTKINDQQKKYAIMHALGHCVGLGDCSTMFSIMQPEKMLEENPNLWTGFSMGDEMEIVRWYPLNAKYQIMECNPSVLDNNGTFNLDLDKEYTITPTINYAWCIDPTFDFTVEQKSGEEDCYTFKKEGNSLKLCFTGEGVCEVTAIATDRIDKTQYKFTKTFKVVYAKPSFEVPSNIELGKFYDFKIEYKQLGVTPQYEMKVDEHYFGVEDNVDIRKIGDGHYQIMFKDYGDYTVTAKVTNIKGLQERVFKFVSFYRPEYELEKPIWNWDKMLTWQEWDSQSAEITKVYTFKIDFLPGNTLPHNLVFNTQVTMLTNIFHLPERVDRVLEPEEKELHTFCKGTSSHFEIQRNSTHEELGTDYYKDTLPFDCTITYPEEDKCGILN